MTTVLELIGELGIATDFASFAAAASAMAKLKDATAKATATAELGTAIKHVYGDAEKAAKLIGLNYDETGAKAAIATSRTERWGKAFLALNQGLEVGLKLVRGVQAGINLIAEAVQATSNQASRAIDIGQRVGLDPEAVQELGFAAGQSATNIDELAGGMGKLANTLDNARKGGKDAAAALRAVGLSKADAGKPLDQTIGKVADAFAKLPDGAKKAALAADLFGGSGVKLIPLLNKGAAGIAELRAEARRLGVVIDKDAAGALQGFGDETDKLHQQLAGVRNQVVVALLPSIMDLVKSAQTWIAANRQLVTDALIGAGRVLLGVVKGLAVALKIAAEVMAFFGRHATFLKILLIALAGVSAILATAVTIAFASLAAPAMVMAAIVLGIIKLVRLAGPAFRTFGRVALTALRAVGEAIRWVGSMFVAVWRGIVGAARGAWSIIEAIGAGLKAVFAPVFAWFEAKYNWLKDKADWIIDKWHAVVGGGGGGGEGVAPGASPSDPKGWGALLGRAPAAAATAPGAAPGPGPVTMTANVTVNATTGADAKEIAAHAKVAAKDALMESRRATIARKGGAR